VLYAYALYALSVPLALHTGPTGNV